MGSHFQVNDIEPIPSRRADSDKSDLPVEALSSIREMADTFGVSIRALRFYEDRGLLHPRRQGSVRYYDGRDKKHLKLILKGKQLGFTLSEIHEMIESQDADGSKTELELMLHPDQIIAQLNHLQKQRDEIDIAIAGLREAHQRYGAKNAQGKSR